MRCFRAASAPSRRCGRPSPQRAASRPTRSLRSTSSRRCNWPHPVARSPSGCRAPAGLKACATRGRAYRVPRQGTGDAMLDTLTRHWTRRELFRRSGLLALPAIFRGGTGAAASPAARSAAAPAAADGLRVGEDIYQSIGVRPLINARGTFTIISGSLLLPEVRAAVDAAAEILTVPNVHLENGATLVAYSGGKCIRGPQSAGLLLGRKDLVRAAWVHSAPHHGFSRSMKVGKEEAVGMLMAVEMWVKRDHKAEWNRWMSWLDSIAAQVSRVEGVTTAITQTTELSNRTPSLTIRWDRRRLGIGGVDLAQHLLDTEPRIATPGGRDRGDEASISITPYQMASGEEKIVAEKIYAALSHAPRQTAPARAAAPASDVSGPWDVQIDALASASTHTLHLTQSGNRLEGSHQGDVVSGDLSGTR